MDGAWFEATWPCLGVGNVNLHVLHPDSVFFFFFGLLFLASGIFMLKGAEFWATNISPCLSDKLMASLFFQCSDFSYNYDVLSRNLGQLIICYLFKHLSLNILYLHGNTLHPSECASNCSARGGCMSILRMDWFYCHYEVFFLFFVKQIPWYNGGDGFLCMCRYNLWHYSSVC